MKKLSNRLQLFAGNSALSIRLLLAFGRWVPPRLGVPLSLRLADFIAAQRNWQTVRHVRLNQWVARGQRCSTPELDLAVRSTLRCQARALYDFSHCLAHPAKLNEKMILAPEILEFIAASQAPAPGRGIVLVGVHLSNFDLALHAIARRGFKGLVITLADLPGGYQKQFDLRRSAGMELAPASISAFRLALERLRAGGIVVTGIDRPVKQPRHFPAFFGHPAPLPVHHVYLALKAQAPIILLAVVQQPDGRYRFRVSAPIAMQPGPDRETETLRNAEAVLAAAEPFIAGAPEQWAMFLPVWPDLAGTLPG